MEKLEHETKATSSSLTKQNIYQNVSKQTLKLIFYIINYLASKGSRKSSNMKQNIYQDINLLNQFSILILAWTIAYRSILEEKLGLKLNQFPIFPSRTNLSIKASILDLLNSRPTISVNFRFRQRVKPRDIHHVPPVFQRIGRSYQSCVDVESGESISHLDSKRARRVVQVMEGRCRRDWRIGCGRRNGKTRERVWGLGEAKNTKNASRFDTRERCTIDACTCVHTGP